MADDAVRQYLTFSLCGERLALPSLLVSEVLDVPPVTFVPLAPGHLRGVVNLRGNAATVVDLRSKLELTDADAGEASCLVIVERDFDGETIAVASWRCLMSESMLRVIEMSSLTMSGDNRSTWRRLE